MGGVVGSKKKWEWGRHGVTTQVESGSEVGWCEVKGERERERERE